MESNTPINFKSIMNFDSSNKRLGKGSFAKVKLLRNKLTGAQVALKIVDLSNSENFEEEHEQIDVECKVHSKLDHPNIIK